MDALKCQRYGMLALRITIGWYFLYAGFTKLIDSQWSAAGYLQHAASFNGFYSWLASPGLLPIVNFLNEWGLFLIGLSLLLGVFVRWSGILGAIMMILYYFPVLTFPTVGEHAYLIDEHLIYAAGLLALAGYYYANPAWLRKMTGGK